MDLSSPMTSRPWGEQGKGGNHPGMKDGVAVGQPSGGSEVSSPLNRPWGQGTSTAGGPVGMQVTEDIGPMTGGKFPTGTAV